MSQNEIISSPTLRRTLKTRAVAKKIADLRRFAFGMVACAVVLAFGLATRAEDGGSPEAVSMGNMCMVMFG